MQPPMILITGDDHTLLQRAKDEQVTALVAAHETDDVIYAKSMSDVMQTPMFSTFIIVVFNDPTADQVKGLSSYLDDPAPDRVVIVTSKKPLVALQKKVTANNGTNIKVLEKTSMATVQALLADKNLNMQAKHMIIEQAGEEPHLVVSLLDSLESVYGTERTLGVEEVTEWLFTAGSKTMWSLLDAIDNGNAGQALGIFQRVWGRDTNPVGISVLLRGHLEKMYRLQQAGIKDPVAGREFLGYKSASTYPAKKAITLANRYKGAVEPLLVLANQTDASLRGNKGVGVPAKLMLELLIARMCSYPRR